MEVEILDSSVSVGCFDSWLSDITQGMYAETIGSKMEPQGKTSNHKISKVKRQTEGNWGKVARKTGRGIQEWCHESQWQQFPQRQSLVRLNVIEGTSNVYSRGHGWGSQRPKIT